MKAIRLKLILLFTLFALASCQTAAEKRLDENADKRAKLHYQLGVDAIHKGTIPKAFEELYISDKIKPDQPETLDAIAYAWRLHGDNKQAEKSYKKAIKAGARSATFNNYASLLIELGKYEIALENLRVAAEDPRYRSQELIYVNMGDAYVGLNNLVMAVKSYKQARQIAKTWTYPQLREADAYIKFNRPNYAQALYETILKSNPINQDALSRLIRLLKGKGKNMVLQQYIETFISKNPNKLEQAWAKDELLLLNQS